MLLHDLQVELGFEGKCGIESRPWVAKLYGGYFYTDSIDVGRIRYKTVRKAVDERISPDVGVLLKRACTEFEMAKGPSDQWQYTESDEHWEKMVRERFDIGFQDTPQPDYVQLHIMLTWMEKAWAAGDMTVMEFNDGKPLMNPYVTYHDNTKEVKKWRNSNV